MDFTDIALDRDDGLATLTIDRPERLNALTIDTVSQLSRALDALRQDGSTRALLLTSAGRAFCSGADLSGERPEQEESPLATHFNPLLEKLRALPFPVVTAVNGAAVGGGCGYALSADIVVAARSAYFLLPFVNIGLCADVGSTWMLPRMIGLPRAAAMMMMGERVSAEQAHGWGMIYEVVDDGDLLDRARTLAMRLARGPTVALGLMRRALFAGSHMALGEVLAMEARNQTIAADTEDAGEGLEAFAGKRPPRFAGR